MRIRANVDKRVLTLDKVFEGDSTVVAALARALGDEFRSYERRVFNTEGAEGIGPWKPLSPRYREWKTGVRTRAEAYIQDIAKTRRGKPLPKHVLRAKMGAEDKILQLTGEMKRAFTVRNHVGHIEKGEGAAGKIRVTLGGQGKGFDEHLRGRNAPPLPIRNMIHQTEEQIKKYRQIAHKTMVKFAMRYLRVIARVQGIG